MLEKFDNRKLEGTISVTLDKETDGKPARVWTADKASIIDKSVFIVGDYQSQGYTLTLRQLYYQLVGRDWIPNHDKVYKKLSKILDDCRYSGIIDWDAIEDRGRIPYTPYTEVNIPDSIKRVEGSYNLDKRLGQPVHVELWSEKDAISGILKRATREYTTTVVINKGFIPISTFIL